MILNSMKIMISILILKLSGEGGPRPRMGHSLLHIKTAKDSRYEGYTYLVMFGGASFLFDVS